MQRWYVKLLSVPLVRLFFICLIFGAVGCATSKVGEIGFAAPGQIGIKTIALAPSGGLLADAIGVDLANRGYTVIDTQQTSALLARVNMTEIEVMSPKSLSTLSSPW